MEERVRRDSSAWDLAAPGAVQAVIRPDETRQWLIRWLEVHRPRLTGGVGQRLMRAWPAGF